MTDPLCPHCNKHHAKETLGEIERNAHGGLREVALRKTEQRKQIMYALAGMHEVVILLQQARTNMQEAGAMNCKTRQWFNVSLAATREIRKHVEKLAEVKG